MQNVMDDFFAWRGGNGKERRGETRENRPPTRCVRYVLRSYRFYHILGEASGMKATLMKGDQENIVLSIMFFPIVFSYQMTWIT